MSVAVRRKQRQQMVGDIPVELFSEDHPVWQSEDTTRAWLEGWQIDTQRMRLHVGPANRYADSLDGWARANGYTVQFSNGCQTVNYVRLHEAGVPPPNRRAIAELLATL